METVESVTTRGKSYKLVQMLESKSVRETVDQHWKELAEVTFDSGRGNIFCLDNVPCDNTVSTNYT